jgi:hypothetical protein
LRRLRKGDPRQDENCGNRTGKRFDESCHAHLHEVWTNASRQDSAGRKGLGVWLRARQ